MNQTETFWDKAIPTNRFILSIQQEIEKLEPGLYITNRWVALFSDVAWQNLQIFLKQFENNTSPLTLHTLQVCSDYLSDYWQIVNKTDAAYPHNPDILINKAHQILARQVALHLNLPFYQILMPSVSAHQCQLTRNKLEDFALHEFVLADDGQPIDVASCLDNMWRNKDIHLYTTSFPIRKLNESEKLRVIHHSIEAEDYYQTLIYFLKRGQIYSLSNKDKNKPDDLSIAYMQFHHAIKESGYEVKASYGDLGMNKLAQFMIKKISDSKLFFELMLTYFEPMQWSLFIKPIPTDRLIKWLQQNVSLITAVQNYPLYSKNDKQNKAILFCFAEILKRDLQVDKDAKGIFGFFADVSQRYLGVYRKFIGGLKSSEREKSVDWLQKFLKTPMTLSQFELFLDQENVSEKERMAFTEVLSPLSFIIQKLYHLGQQSADVSRYTIQKT